MQQKQTTMTEDIKNHIGLLMFVLFVPAKPMEAMWRVPGTCGVRYFSNICGYVSVPVLFVYAGLAKSPAAMQFALAYLGLLMAHRFKTLLNERNGRYEHSWYWGDSWMERLGFSRKFEVAVTFMAGLVLTARKSGLGPVFLAGSIGLLAVAETIAARDRNDERAIRDAQIQQQYFQDRTRRG